MKLSKARYEKRFLLDGAKLYPQTLIAVSEFCRLVQGQWRETVSKSLPQLGRAVGVKLNPKMIEDYADPAETGGEIQGHCVELGVRIKEKNDWDQYFVLEWNDPPGEKKSFGAGAWLYLHRSQGISPNAHAAMKKVRLGCELHPHPKGVSIWQPIAPGQSGSIPDVIQQVSRDWIRFWHEVGGLNACLARRTKRRRHR